jgi:hypothetical protein
MKLWRSARRGVRDRQMPMGCLAEKNCVDPITFVRFARAGASQGRIERGLDTPQNDRAWRRERRLRAVWNSLM